MCKVLVFGTFDILHPGHIWFLRQARRRGEHLTVVVTRDQVALRIKNKKPHFNERERMAMLGALRMVNRVVLGDREGTSKVVKRERPDLICWGYDQQREIAKKFNPVFLQSVPQMRLKAYKTHIYASSKIKTTKTKAAPPHDRGGRHDPAR